MLLSIASPYKNRDRARTASHSLFLSLSFSLRLDTHLHRRRRRRAQMNDRWTQSKQRKHLSHTMRCKTINGPVSAAEMKPLFGVYNTSFCFDTKPQPKHSYIGMHILNFALWPRRDHKIPVNYRRFYKIRLSITVVCRSIFYFVGFCAVYRHWRHRTNWSASPLTVLFFSAADWASILTFRERTPLPLLSAFYYVTFKYKPQLFFYGAFQWNFSLSLAVPPSQCLFLCVYLEWYVLYCLIPMQME